MLIRLLIILLCVGTIHSDSLGSERGRQEIEELAYKTACEQATFTFRVDTQINEVETSFFIHFTDHYLPFSCLSAHTKKLLDSANTVVIEPRPLEDEPLDQMEKAYEVFQKYCMDAEFHGEFHNYMKTTCLPYYNELKEKYEKFKSIGENPLEKMVRKYDIKFEDLSPLFISNIKDRNDSRREGEKGMDNEIDKYALEHKKTRTGLDSVLKNFIFMTPKRLTLEKLSPEQKKSINQYLYAQLYYSKHPQEAEEIKKKTENSDDDTWDATYKNGHFSKLSLNKINGISSKEIQIVFISETIIGFQEQKKS